MPAVQVAAVDRYRPLIDDITRRLSEEREGQWISSPVVASECAALLDDIRSLRTPADDPGTAPLHNAAVETVIRELFIDMVATVDIAEPAFAQVWVLLDVVTVLSDHDLCEPGLGFWLIEELLDSQTIDGCRMVFDYLDSRRERITAKNFKHKSLVILRCCNELLRRLSRAEDIVFCGRVFIFLFQSFPLGDKSSVNLRGEFHVENVTTFDPAPMKSDDAIKPMELDASTPPATSGAQTPASGSQLPDPETIPKTGKSTPIPRAAKPEPKEQAPPDLDALYPQFWSLQTLFSSPTRLFEPAGMAALKDGIGATLACFKCMSPHAAANHASAEVPRGLKRKRTEQETSGTASTFNPKYLTNRDLFDLEIHDVAFRRHILVQALIMIDFLLSLAPAAKAKTEGLTNKSVLYTYTLSDDDAKWAQTSRAAIASYLQQGNGTEGKFYYRMVDTVLSRDKNWVRWKAENCPPISRASVSPQRHVESQTTLGKLADAQRAPLPAPAGAADLAFLSSIEPLEALKRPSARHRVPTTEEYYREIERDDLDLDFAVTDEEKREIEERKAGKLWRALRVSDRRFALCEKVQYGGSLQRLVEDDPADEHGDEPKEKAGDGEDRAEHDEAGSAARSGHGAAATAEDTGPTDGALETPGRSHDTGLSHDGTGLVAKNGEGLDARAGTQEKAGDGLDANGETVDAEMTDAALADGGEQAPYDERDGDAGNIDE